MLVIAGRTGSALTGAVYVSKDTAVPAVRRTTAALRLMAQVIRQTCSDSSAVTVVAPHIPSTVEVIVAAGAGLDMVVVVVVVYAVPVITT